MFGTRPTITFEDGGIHMVYSNQYIVSMERHFIETEFLVVCHFKKIIKQDEMAF
jgi:hypothetical protein